MRCYPLLATYCRHCGNARLLQAPRNESQEFSCFGLSYSWFMRLLRPVQQEISERNLRSMVHEVLAQVHSQRFSTLTFVLWNTSEGFDIPTSRKNSSGWKLPCCPAKDCFWKCWWKMNQTRCCVWLVCLINTGTKPSAVQAGVWYGSTASVLSLYPDSRRQKTQRRGLAGILS